jgi:hypothetical protein
LDPLGEGQPFWWNRHEQMDVFGHDHVSADGYISLFRSLTECMECVMNFRSGKKSNPLMSVERHEVKRPDILKDKSKPGRSPGVRLTSFFHRPMLGATDRKFNLESL